MNKNDFLNLYNLSSWEESETFEWKLSTRLAKEIVQTIVSFSNTRGGVLLCGVSDDGEVVGQDISDATLREIAQTVLANTEERLYPSIERCTIEGKSVLAIHITASPLRPHNAYGRSYKRVGASNILIDQSEYFLLLGQKRNGGGADRDMCEDAPLSVLDQEAIYRFIAVANEKRNLNIPLFSDIPHILSTLELMSPTGILKGAVLLFGKNPQSLIPAAEFRVAHFADEKREVFLSQKIFTGDLFSQLTAVIDFVKERLPLVISTSLNGDRTQRKIPISVVQELVANAIVHRDYRQPSSSYLNIIGEDHLEIINPGLLPAPIICPETMHLAHPSVPINRRIARVFFLSGLIEQWGEGTRRVWRQLTEAGLPAPHWESERGIVRVVVKA